ncbi:TDT family transporter [Biostraticola tofi]|uniref:Tellurite resistance protein TehA-like permease n=2 Tax=Biostraticola tofi TaxID=466109 RepID=A0A4R3Z449_9GAMM|nr:TDT family transporter [Biostraticola tofi]TCV99828.1 tellurite resistance protein TehA-like permease [Biostraticola tofi]
MMRNTVRLLLKNVPTPMAGLALGIASLGWCLENALALSGAGQLAGAVIAALLLLALTGKFLLHPTLLSEDLRHAVVGSVVPTYAMGWMVVSKALSAYCPVAGQILWLAAVAVHLVCLVVFIWHRSQAFRLHHMVPSWFVPPVGIIVAAVASPGGPFNPMANLLLDIGMMCYTVMLPVMLYRLIFCDEIADAAKPTIAIMAAPASLSLAGYLTVVEHPSLLICAVLLGIALLMTAITYVAFIRLLRLPFSPGFAAFTFPMAIGATALYKLAHYLGEWPLAQGYARQLHRLATIEVTIATVIIGYVIVRYLMNYLVQVKPPLLQQ